MGFRVLGLWGLGFRVSGLGLMGFRALGFRGFGFRAMRQALHKWMRFSLSLRGVRSLAMMCSIQRCLNLTTSLREVL